MEAISKTGHNTPDKPINLKKTIFNSSDGTISVTSQNGTNTGTATQEQAGRSFLKDPGSALTHLIGVLLSVTGSVPLYLASTLYHSINASEKITCILQKFDHIMIYFLIAGTYTPICLLALPKSSGIPLLALIWGLTVCGFILTVTKMA